MQRAAVVDREVALHPEAKKVRVMDKTCLCTHMRNFEIWTCGQSAWRLKDTSVKDAEGKYQLLTAELANVAEDLKAGRTVAPRLFASATVLFSDIVGSTPYFARFGDASDVARAARA